MEGQRVEFPTGYGTDVMPGQYQVTITDAKTGAPLKDYALDLR